MVARFFLRCLGFVLGLALEIAGLLGASNNSGTSPVISLFEHPWVYIPAVALGTLVLAHTWGEALAEHRISTAGGISKKEFRAKFSEWDKISSFQVWQIAWLWIDLEPFDLETRQTAAYPAFRRLKEHLDAGMVPGANALPTGWRDVSLTRQQLVDYAYKIKERPKFLFREQRGWCSHIAHRLNASNEIAAPEREYQSIYDWYSIGHQMTPPLSADQVRAQLISSLRQGKAEAIGRPRRNGIDWSYVKMSRRMWKNIEFDWADSVKCHHLEFVSIRVKYLKNE